MIYKKRKAKPFKSEWNKQNFESSINELDIMIDNDYDTYKQRIVPLQKNYQKKWDKGRFDFAKAEKGIFNLIVTPTARKVSKEARANQWGTPIWGVRERKAVAKRITRKWRDDLVSNNWSK